MVDSESGPYSPRFEPCRACGRKQRTQGQACVFGMESIGLEPLATCLPPVHWPTGRIPVPVSGAPRHHLQADRRQGDQGQLDVLDAKGDPNDCDEAGQG